MTAVTDRIKKIGISIEKARAHIKDTSKQFCKNFTVVDCENTHCGKNFLKAVRNNKFLVQLFQEAQGIIRLSIQYTELNATGDRWKDGITWDEIQHIKDELGFDGACAVEIYPPKDDIVNVANIRHIWILPSLPSFMWKK